MEFRPRNYVVEEQSHALPRSRAGYHPLSSPSPHTLLHQDGDDDIVENRTNEEVFFDPLRAPDSNASVEIADGQGFESSSNRNDDSVQLQTKEWTSFKRLLMQRFPVSKMISVSSMSNTIVRGGKAHEKSSTSMHLEELDDPQKSSEESAKVITRQEYVSRLHELKDEINRAWHDEDRVKSLKLSIKLEHLQVGCQASNGYIRFKFLSNIVCPFYALGRKLSLLKMDPKFAPYQRILEQVMFVLMPKKLAITGFVRLDRSESFFRACEVHFVFAFFLLCFYSNYLELAILPCWRFLTEQPAESLNRLVMMTRGLADPVAFAYCHLYIAHRAQRLPLYDTGYLITCVNDIKLVFTRISSAKETAHGSLAGSKRSLVSLMEPAVEFIMKCIFNDGSLRRVGKVLVELGLGRSHEELFGGPPCVSIVLHHLLKELPTDVIGSHAVDILHLIKCSNDYSYDQFLNYRLLGLRLCEQISQIGTVDAIVNEVIQVVSQCGLDEYLKVVDAYLDIILQNQMDGYLKTILEEISELASDKVIAEDELAGLQSILVKVLSHFKDLEDVFSLNHFLQILDLMHGSSRSIVNMHILDMATRNGYICDPTTIQLLFEISQAMHNDTDIANMKNDDNHQQARLISRFVRMVDHGAEYERHLAFLVECRGAFGSISELKEILVHSSNCLATKALKDEKKHLSFIKSCIAFSEVTIPSISGQIKQLHLYLETAEVALLGGLVSHSDGLIGSALTCLESFDWMEGSRAAVDSDRILSAIQKLFSLLITVPGDPEVGILHIPKRILSIICSQSWSPKIKARIFCAILSLSATLSQGRLPYRTLHPEIMGNDLLFFGDSSYVHELVSLAESALENLVDVIEQEPSRAARGSMSLEACNCMASSFKINEHVSPVCSKLIETAKSCLSAKDKYLISTLSFLDKNLPAATVTPSIVI
ncbi:hypothetical protein PTKIN_Ptkin06aG0211000 [Pterospermum kingtungense]